MSKTYLVKLRPLSSYYFGGELGFGGGDSRNYLVRSRKWPQQTGLLGMVRYLLLQEKGWLAEKGKPVDPEGKKIIGDSSFALGDEKAGWGGKMDFGEIESLSPVFLMKGDEKYYRAPRNHGYDTKPFTDATVWYGGTPGEFQPAIELKGFEAKKGLEKADFVTTLAFDKLFTDKAVFQAVEQTGIEKGEGGETKDQALYKQTFYRLAKDWSFGFYLTVKDDAEIPASARVPFGGEKRLFAWEAGLREPQPPWLREPQPPIGLFLLSDALVSPEILDHCDFAVTETEDFRFLETVAAETVEYSQITRGDKKAPRKSEKYNLLKAGSVLYPKDKTKVETMLHSERLRQIGYNHFTYIS
ncbi:MAG: type III-B CRISPR module-associated Cmr3 family protein [Bacteroidia bacterium]|nr:type III-B CRISPR module-associated Cmr3 family protein [Bacteroidia bacterium]